MSRATLARIGWIAVATVVLVYAPMAVEFTARLFGFDAPRLWDHAFGGAIGDERALGDGSIHHEQQGVYEQHRWVLLAHTTLGGTAIALFVWQLSDRSRRRLQLHRVTGRVAATLAVAAMLGAFTYLVLVGPDRTYDGPAFYLQLWALAIGTLAGTVAGVVAIRRRQLAMHQVFMFYAFALLCTAPFLRVLYIVLGLAWPDSTQEVTNLAGGAILGVWAPLAAALASRTRPVPPGRDHLSPLPGPVLDRVVGAAALLGAAALVVAYLSAFDGLDRISVTGLVAYLAGLACTGLNRRASRDTAVPAEEWRVLHLSLLSGLPLTALLWAAYAVPFPTEAAWYGALLTGPPLGLTLGILVIALRRRTPARVPREAVPAR